MKLNNFLYILFSKTFEMDGVSDFDFQYSGYLISKRPFEFYASK